MVPLKNADSDRIIQLDVCPRFRWMDSLMMCVPDPGERAQDRDDNRKVCKYAHNQHRVMVVAVINEDQDHFEY
jgi:hypothetical protein